MTFLTERAAKEFYPMNQNRTTLFCEISAFLLDLGVRRMHTN